MGTRVKEGVMKCSLLPEAVAASNPSTVSVSGMVPDSNKLRGTS